MVKEYNVLVFEEDGKYIARCVELLVVETGNSEIDALNNLKKCIVELSKEYKLKNVRMDLEKLYEDFLFVKRKIVIWVICKLEELVSKIYIFPLV